VGSEGHPILVLGEKQSFYSQNGPCRARGPGENLTRAELPCQEAAVLLLASCISFRNLEQSKGHESLQRSCDLSGPRKASF
jgi:hypothetical protein